MRNVPDDYDQYWEKCPDCGTQWHPAEATCNCPYCEECGDRITGEPIEVGQDNWPICQKCADKLE